MASGNKNISGGYCRDRIMTAPIDPDIVFAVTCPSCDWTGMSDDCRYNECPWCGRRVVREKDLNDV